MTCLALFCYNFCFYSSYDFIWGKGGFLLFFSDPDPFLCSRFGYGSGFPIANLVRIFLKMLTRIFTPDFNPFKLIQNVSNYHNRWRMRSNNPLIDAGNLWKYHRKSSNTENHPKSSNQRKQWSAKIQY